MFKIVTLQIIMKMKPETRLRKREGCGEFISRRREFNPSSGALQSELIICLLISGNQKPKIQQNQINKNQHSS